MPPCQTHYWPLEGFSKQNFCKQISEPVQCSKSRMIQYIQLQPFPGPVMSRTVLYCSWCQYWGVPFWRASALPQYPHAIKRVFQKTSILFSAFSLHDLEVNMYIVHQCIKKCQILNSQINIKTHLPHLNNQMPQRTEEHFILGKGPVLLCIMIIVTTFC